MINNVTTHRVLPCARHNSNPHDNAGGQTHDHFHFTDKGLGRRKVCYLPQTHTGSK